MNARPSSSMIGTVLSGRYRLEAKLGSGGMSTVYLARDETLDRPVAVKVMHREMSEQEDQLQRFRQEARAVAKLTHPNVVSVIDAGEDGGHPYIVFEYVKGETLKQRIARVGALDTQEAIAYAIEVARGLSVAHARNMVHRDIKPQNVLIDDEGRAKLTDFGISRQLEQDGMTATGRVLGTTDYVAPEQAMGKGGRPALRHLLARRRPLRDAGRPGPLPRRQPGRGGDETRQRGTARRAAAAARGLGARWRWWSSARRPRTRPSATRTVGEMIDDLETALEVEAARAGSTTGEATSVLDAVPPPKRKLSGRARWSWAAIALLVLVGGGALLAVQLISSGIGGGGANEGKGGDVALSGATDYDPQGDGEEVGSKVELAADGDPTGTAWETEHYDSETFEGTKTGPDPGVGVYVTTSLPGDAGEDDRAHPDARAGTPRSSPRRPARRPTSPAGANRWARRRSRRDAGDRPRRQPALDLLPALVHQGLRSPRPAGPLPDRDQRHRAAGLTGSRPRTRASGLGVALDRELDQAVA